LKEQGDDELGLLVKSFNQMTAEIKATQQQSEERRLYLETVLSSLAVSVVSLDADLRILALNLPAARMLGIPDIDKVLGKKLWEIVPPGFVSALEGLFESEVIKTTSESGFVLERQFSLDLRGSIWKFWRQSQNI